jgi:RNA-binding protein Musashi
LLQKPINFINSVNWVACCKLGMGLEQGKLFIGGISWETTEKGLKDHFKAFGDVVDAMVMKDRSTGRSRGFGFVIFSDSAVAERVAQVKHTIDGRMVCCVLHLES